MVAGRQDERPFRALDFFAGSGLVSLGLEPEFATVWANDVCARKAAVYRANLDDRPFHLTDIASVRGASLPEAELVWGSFPCQDLSLAGKLGGLRKGTRSGLFWEWLRVIDELTDAGRRPPVLVAENVTGFLTARGSAHFRRAHRALRERGYIVGALVIDASLFVPQSRPRAFVVAVATDVPLEGLVRRGPTEPFHPELLQRAAAAVADPGWVWWSLPTPTRHGVTFGDLCERHAICDSDARTGELVGLLSPRNRRKLDAALAAGTFVAGTGYRRTRPAPAAEGDGARRQRLEIRFDGIAGCLRTPEGGSSRQVVVQVEGGSVRTRLMTVRECARLMGAPDTFEIPGLYNDGYRAMGDAVAVPVVRWLSEHLLAPLAGRARGRRVANDGSTRDTASSNAA
jgi:DNA (cytosine-5)-methyltransferase 1